MGKYLLLLLLFLISFSCRNEKNSTSIIPKIAYQKKVVPVLQNILDSADIHGTILLLDASAKQYYSNNFVWCEKGKLPASTFKIPNTIIALESGVVAHDSVVFKWDGTKRAFKIWEQDLIFRDAFKYSCVPCYQKVAREIGVRQMTEYITKFDYGSISVDSTNLENFWLTGKARITPFQQIGFLKKLYESQLPISKRTEKMVKDIMVLDEQAAYKLSGKTGWSVDNEKNNGWFVGYLETAGKVYYFATNVEPNPTFAMDSFAGIRKEVTYKAFRNLKILQ